MSDLVKRLREYVENIRGRDEPPSNYLAGQAADEINRLRAALEEIVQSADIDLDVPGGGDPSGCVIPINLIEGARTALRPVESQRKTQLEAGIERLRACLKECSDDLAQYVDREYPNRGEYGAQRRRYERDIGPVIEARKLLDGPAGTD